MKLMWRVAKTSGQDPTSSGRATEPSGVEVDADAEAVRTLRNAGRAWFSSTQIITPAQQREWWNARPRHFQHCILVGFGDAYPIGYGMLIERAGRSWVSLAVDPDARGGGVGTEIYKLLAAHAGTPVFAAIWRDNLASRRAAEHAGYVFDDAVPAPGVQHPGEWIVLRSRTEV